jgi:hypothetical protein
MSLNGNSNGYLGKYVIPPPPLFFFIWREMICSLSNFNEVKFIKNKIKSIPHVLLNQMKGLRSDYLPSFFNFYFFFLLTAKNLAKGLGQARNSIVYWRKNSRYKYWFWDGILREYFSRVIYTNFFLFFLQGLNFFFYILETI